MTRGLISAAIAAAVLTFTVPTAHADPQGPRNQRYNADQDTRRAELLEREQVRRKQVRQNANRPVYQPLFHNLYQGHNSPVQRTKRAFN